MNRTLLMSIVVALTLLALAPLALAMPEAAGATKTPRANQSTPGALATPTRARATGTPQIRPPAASDDSSMEQAEALAPVSPGPMSSTVVLYNRNKSKANATLHVLDGATEIYSKDATIAPLGVAVIALPNSIGTGFLGSGMISSDLPVDAIVLNANGKNTARDEYEAATPANTLVFPVYRNLGSAAQKSVIYIQNTESGQAADVSIHLYEANGAEAEDSPILRTIEPRASIALDSFQLFGTAGFTRTVEIESGSRLVGSEQVLYTTDTASLRGLGAPSMAEEFLLGWIQRAGTVTSQTNWSEVYVHNSGDEAATVKIDYVTVGGAKKTSETKTIQGHGYALFNTRLLTGLGSFTGYARLTQQGAVQPLSAAWLEANSAGKKLYAYEAVSSANYAAGWLCGNVRRVTGTNPQITTFKIVNPDTTSASVTLLLFDPTSGAQKVKKTLTVAPGKLVSVAIGGSAYSAVGSGYIGLASFQSTGARVVVTALTSFGSKSVTSHTCTALP